MKFSQVVEKSQTQIGFTFFSGGSSAKLWKSDNAPIIAIKNRDTSAGCSSESVIQNRITEISLPSESEPADTAANDIDIGCRTTGNSPPPPESESVHEDTSICIVEPSESKDNSNLPPQTETDTQPSMVEDSSSSDDDEEKPHEHIPDLQVEKDGPCQPVLSSYAPRKFSNEKFERDFQSSWFAKYKWLGYSTQTQSAYCYACEKFGSNKFILTNWKKADRLKKHSVGEPHKLAMTKWMSFRAQQRQYEHASVMSLLDSSHKQMIAKNRKYLQVIIECLMFTAQQNIAQRGHEESRVNIGAVSDTNRGNFLELLHLRCKDLPWFAEMLNSKLESHEQWTSPIIQNELLGIMV